MKNFEFSMGRIYPRSSILASLGHARAPTDLTFSHRPKKETTEDDVDDVDSILSRAKKREHAIWRLEAVDK